MQSGGGGGGGVGGGVVIEYRWCTIPGRFLKCGSVHTLMAKIAHNPLPFGEGFGPELQMRIKLQTWRMRSTDRFKFFFYSSHTQLYRK